MTKRISYYLFAFLILVPFFLFSQKIDSSFVYTNYSKAVKLEKNGDFQEAYRIANSTIKQINEKNKNPIFLSDLYQIKSSIEQKLSKYKTSIKTAQKSLQICLKLKDTFNIAFDYNLMGIGYYFLSEYDSTKIYYEKSYALRKKIKVDDATLAVSAYNLALLYEDLAQANKALKLYKDAMFYLLRTKKDIDYLTDVYVGIAHLYFFSKKINKAEEYSEKAMEVGLKLYGEYNPNMTFVYMISSNILIYKKKYKQAITLLEKSLKIRERTYGNLHKWTCEANYKLAEVLVLDKQNKKAEFYFKKAIKIGENGSNFQYLATAESFLAKLYIDQNIHLQKAKDLLLDALNKNINIFGYKNDIIAQNYYYLAEVSQKTQDKNAFFAFSKQVFRSAAYDKNKLNQIIAPFQSLDALVLMGDWYTKEYTTTHNIKSLEKVYELIDEELALIKFSQENFSSEKSKINFANEYRDVFEKDLYVCWALYHQKKNAKYLDKAFELSETNRNTTLLEGLQDIKYKLLGDIPKELLDLEKDTKQDLELTKINLYYEKKAANPDRDYISKLLNKRIIISDKLDSLHKSFEISYPRYKKLKYQNKIIHLTEVQKNIDENTQLITYFLGDKSLYTFNITKNKITFLKGDVAKEILEKTKVLKENILNQKNISSISKRLYLFLLDQQIEKSKTNLNIVPDNVLNYIPFEILMQKKHYLIEDYTISYSGSVSLFLELKDNSFKYNSKNYWAGFAPIYKNNQKLSSNFKEISTIANIVDGKVFSGKQCSKQSFLSNNKDYSILHLAMHTSIDNENPMFNKLIFNNSELSASEIYLSQTHANLAVLSACSTGFGKLEKGEGVMSMARAFHFSGVPSVIMSLWKVPDKETNKIMVDFYKHLEKGEKKDQALKNAKLDYLNSTSDLVLKQPFYWSGFVINGNTDNLMPKKKYYYIVIGAFLIFALLFWKVKIKKS